MLWKAWQLKESATRQVLNNGFCIFNVGFLGYLKINLGPYSCPIHVLSCAKHIISGPLAHIIRVFVHVFFFTLQAEKKRQTLYPVYRNDDESDPGNYRPMSLRSIFSRMYYRLIRAYNHGQKLLTNKNYQRCTLV